jgi:hypothetical protein
MLVARRALEALTFPIFERIHSEDGTDIIKGPDYLFCEKVRSAGMQIHAHFGYNCNHVKEMELGTTIERLVRFTNDRGLSAVGEKS